MNATLKFQTRIIAYLAVMIISSVQTVKAQDNDICHDDWSKWYNAYNFGVNSDLQIAFKYLRKGMGSDCATASNSYYKISIPFVQKGRFISFKFDYRNADGTVGTQNVTVEMDKAGETMRSFYFGYEMVGKPYDFKDSEKDKAKKIKDDVNATIVNYNKQYNDAIAAVNQVKDPTKHNQLLQQINANKDSFHQLDLQAQEQMNKFDGDALEQTLSQMKEQQGSLKTIYLQIDPDEPTTTKNTTTIAKNTNAPITLTAPKTTTTNSTTTKQQQYQNQSNEYLNKADNTDQQGSIQQAYDLNMAKINALGAGNNAQIQAIQQQQNQQIQKQISDVGNKLGDLVNLFFKSRPTAPTLTIQQRLLKDDENTASISDEMDAESNKQHDKYGNVIWENDVMVNGLKQNLTAKEMYNNGVMENGKFHNSQKAMEWFVKAANKNSIEATYRLALLSAANDNIDIAVDLFVKTALLLDSIPAYEIESSYHNYELDYCKKAINSLTIYYEYGYLVDDENNKIQANYQNASKTNYLQSLFFLYKLIPAKKENDEIYFAPENAIADLFLRGDTTLQKNVARAVDYYTMVLNKYSKEEYYQKNAMTSLANIFEKGIDVNQDPDKALEYYNKILILLSADKKNNKYQIKDIEKAISNCEKLKKPGTITSNSFDPTKYAGIWNCKIVFSGSGLNKSDEGKMNLEIDKNGFIKGALGNDAFKGFITSKNMHIFYDRLNDNSFQVESDFVIINENELNGNTTSFKLKPTDKKSNLDGINITMTLSR